MNTNNISGSWEYKKSKFKRRFEILTQDDLMFAGENIEELQSKLKIKLGKTKAEFQEIIKSL